MLTTCLNLAAALAAASVLAPIAAASQPVAIRVASFNIEDLRTHELLGEGSERARAAAAVLQRIRPNTVLINEIAYDEPGSPGFREGDEPGQNGARFAAILARSQGPGLEPLRYRAFTAPSNTGRASGFDLDRSGETVVQIPDQAPPGPDGRPARQTPEDRAYGGDSWGFGAFPGQYGMALLVDERLEILDDRARTFRLFPWSAMPNNLMPPLPEGAQEAAPPFEPEGDEPDTTDTDAEAESDEGADNTDEQTDRTWYEGEAAELFRLSSKSHWDIPVRLPNGGVVHVLASHPTPPAFDGPEERNKRRNHDEIRLLGDYIAGASYIVDDAGVSGGLGPGRSFVILGDLNADPDEGSAVNNPIDSYLLRSRRVAGEFVPVMSQTEFEALSDSWTGRRALDPDDTAMFGLRVDYALPSADLTIRAGGVWAEGAGTGDFPSDHFPVWIDVEVPAR